ncbi:MAG: hypothetical protein II719_01055 [Clostridia bacterium]|nr:hypothetical protein [Clostridia bacterium]
MKNRILTILASTLLLGALLIGFVGSAADAKFENAFNSDNAFGELINVTEDSGKKLGAWANFCNNQNRVVRTSSGIYVAFLTESAMPGFREFSFFRIDEEGRSTLLYSDYLGADSYGGGTQATIMADKEENIWIYSGWSEYPFINANLWKYDPNTGNITNYGKFYRYAQLDYTVAKSVSMIDPEKNMIYALMPGGDNPGYFMWIPFDINRLEWLPSQMVTLDYVYCYNYAYPLGDGFLVIGHRDSADNRQMTDLGISVKKATTDYNSRKFDSPYVFDYMSFLYIPDPLKPELQNIRITEPEYHVETGMFPYSNAHSTELYIDRSGLIHVLAVPEDYGVPGRPKVHMVYRFNGSEFEEILEQELPYLYGRYELYTQRMVEDAEGNLYILAMPFGIAPQLEIWQATDETGTEWKLVALKKMEGEMMDDPGTRSALVVANSRNNSTPSDKVSLLFDIAGKVYFEFTIDFAAIRSAAANG